MFDNIYAGHFVLSDFYHDEITPRRIVKYYEIEIIEKNTGATFINDAKASEGNTNLLFDKPGDVRFTIGELKCKYLKFSCDDNEICNILNSINSGMIYADCSELGKIIDMVTKIKKSTKPHDRMELMSLICKAISLLRLYHSETPKNKISNTKDAYTNRMIEAKEYIDNHYDEKITLENLASSAYLSPNFFRIKFVETIGISPHDYLIQGRIFNAKKLIASTDTPLSHIALMCGFDSQAYMNYVFKKFTGLSPGEYKKAVLPTADN